MEVKTEEAEKFFLEKQLSVNLPKMHLHLNPSLKYKLIIYPNRLWIIQFIFLLWKKEEFCRYSSLRRLPSTLWSSSQNMQRLQEKSLLLQEVSNCRLETRWNRSGSQKLVRPLRVRRRGHDDWEVFIPVQNNGLGVVAKRPLPADFKIIVEAVYTNPHDHPGKHYN